MIITEFYVITKFKMGKGKLNGWVWDHIQHPGKIGIAGNVVKRLKPPRNMKIGDLYGKVLFFPGDDYEDFFIILRNKRIFPLPIDNYGIEIIEKIIESPSLAAETNSLKLLISFLKL